MNAIKLTREQLACLDRSGHGSIGFNQPRGGAPTVNGDILHAECDGERRKLQVVAINPFPSRITQPPYPFIGYYVAALVENIV